MTRNFGTVLLLSLGLLAGCTQGATSGQDADGDTDPGADEQTALRDHASALEKRLTALQEENAALRNTVAELEGDVGGAPRTQPIGTIEGLEDALRAYLPDPHIPWRPGVTRWRTGELELPSRYTDPLGMLDSAGELTLTLVAAVVDADQFGNHGSYYPWEVTTRVLSLDSDAALAVVQQWGMGDDSISGTDYLFTLARGPQGWYVAKTEERDQCTRNERLPGEDDLPERCV